MRQKNAVTIRLQVFLKSVKLGIYKNAPATTSKSTCPTSLFRHAPRRSTDVGHVGFWGVKVCQEWMRNLNDGMNIDVIGKVGELQACFP
ncbi:MAG: hypothetical protein SPK34_03240 [Bacteroidaceae bacterium]|nr:hypothetical protein [Prevotellaceae bacterium]MDY5759951.1 hypothetical protein [Bacteroidaceae bacterium]